MPPILGGQFLLGQPTNKLPGAVGNLDYSLAARLLGFIEGHSFPGDPLSGFRLVCLTTYFQAFEFSVQWAVYPYTCLSKAFPLLPLKCSLCFFA